MGLNLQLLMSGWQVSLRMPNYKYVRVCKVMRKVKRRMAIFIMNDCYINILKYQFLTN